MLKRIKRRQGSDVLAFAMILPALCILLYAIIVISQLCMCRNSIEYALYEGSRAAVISEDYDSAVVALENVAKSTLIGSTFGVEDSDIHVSIDLVAGTTDPIEGGAGIGNITWEKGAMAECSIEVKIHKLLNIGGETMTARMYVMVERPARTY